MVVEESVEEETPTAVVEGIMDGILMEVGEEATVDEPLRVLKESPRT